MIHAIITQRESLTPYGGRMDSLEQEYAEYFKQFNVCLFPMSGFTDDVEEVANSIPWELLVLTGGGLLEPCAYEYATQGYEQPHRDRVESELLKLALERRVPVLGICRGLQKINVYFGGKIQTSQPFRELRPVRKNHTVELTEGGEKFFVNHYHGDGIFQQTLGQGLYPIAVDQEAENIEAVKHEQYKLLAVQWHPERSDISAEADAWFRKQFLELIKE